MVNETGDSSNEASKGENKELIDVKEEKPLKGVKDFNTTTHLQERLKTLETRIKAVKFDFKAQVEGLRSRMDHLKTDLKTVHGDLEMNSKKTRNDNEASEKL